MTINHRSIRRQRDCRARTISWPGTMLAALNASIFALTSSLLLAGGVFAEEEQTKTKTKMRINVWMSAVVVLLISAISEALVPHYSLPVDSI